MTFLSNFKDFLAQNGKFWCILGANFIALEHHLSDVFLLHLSQLLGVKCQWLCQCWWQLFQAFVCQKKWKMIIRIEAASEDY